MAQDNWNGFKDLDTPSFDRWAAITLDTDIVEFPRAIWADAAGTANIVDADGNAVSFTLIAGVNPLRPSRVNSGGTATGLKALY